MPDDPTKPDPPNSSAPVSETAPAPSGGEKPTDVGAASTMPRGFRQARPEEYGKIPQAAELAAPAANSGAQWGILAGAEPVRRPYGDRMNLYLDLDGVIIRAADSVVGIELAPRAVEFLRWATEFHRPYWLSTRDSHGQHAGILRAFRLAM